MKVTLPDRVTGSLDDLFVLEVEFPVAAAERTVEVRVEGPVEPLDLGGNQRGGTYRVPVGLERLHVPMRVSQDGAAEARVRVACTAGPEAGQEEIRTLVLETPAAAASSGTRGRWLAAGGIVAAVAGLVWLASALLGTATLPDVTGLEEHEARARLEDEGLHVQVTHEPAPTPEQLGRVLRSIPAAGQEAGGSVELVIGTDSLLAVPTVVGMEEDAATTTLRAAGFPVMSSYVDATDPDEAGRVVRQAPTPARRLTPGTQVQIWVGRPTGARPSPSSPAPAPSLDPTPELPEPQPAPVAQQPPQVPDGWTEVPGAEPGAVAEEPARRDPPPARPDTGPGPHIPTGPSPAGPSPAGPSPAGPSPAAPSPSTAAPSSPAAPSPSTPAPAGPVDLRAGPDGRIELPAMAGWKRAEAETRLRDAGLVPIVTTEDVQEAERVGTVLRHRPEAGKRIESSTMVFLTVGQRAPEPAPPPLPERRPDPAPHPDVATGPDAEQPRPDPVAGAPERTPSAPQATPPATPPARGGARAVPDVVGMARERAEGAVRAAGHQYRVVLEETDYPEDGTVLAQDPAPGGGLAEGAEVTIVVARMPAGAGSAVPDVTGMERPEAEEVLRRKAFLVRVTYGGGSREEQGRVVSQAPAGGARASARTWVEIVVAQGTGARVVAEGGPPPALGDVTGPRVRPEDANALAATRPPSLAAGPGARPPPTPRARDYVPPVELPSRDAPKTARVPEVSGTPAREAIAAVLQAGLIPIIEVDRSGLASPGHVARQQPTGATPALPGDLVRLTVSAAPRGADTLLDLPTAMGAEIERARRLFSGTRASVEVVEVRVPGHPYAGTRRVAAQYPVSSVSRAEASPVTLWIVTR